MLPLYKSSLQITDTVAPPNNSAAEMREC